MITVIVPTLNRPVDLIKAVKSISNQIGNRLFIKPNASLPRYFLPIGVNILGEKHRNKINMLYT